MSRTYTLGKPIIAVQLGTTVTTTLPSGAIVEVQQNDQRGAAQILWQKRVYVVHLPDLLDACGVKDVGKIMSLAGSGRSLR